MMPRPEDARDESDPDHYVLRLYVAGASPRSSRVIATLKAACEELLAGNYELEVIDLYQQPQLAAQAQILCLPTLVRMRPLPLRHLVGDLSDTNRLRRALGA